MKVCGSHYCALTQTRFKLARRRLLRRLPPTCALRTSGRDESTHVRQTDGDKTDAWAQFLKAAAPSERNELIIRSGKTNPCESILRSSLSWNVSQPFCLSKVKDFSLKKWQENIQTKRKEMITLFLRSVNTCASWYPFYVAADFLMGHWFGRRKRKQGGNAS